ncbi:MAG: hypothetical protein IPG93_16825 [Burkholderiales bacterium]|nr:hypothetical protein [Burkholderiales bacterium]
MRRRSKAWAVPPSAVASTRGRCSAGPDVVLDVVLDAEPVGAPGAEAAAAGDAVAGARGFVLAGRGARGSPGAAERAESPAARGIVAPAALVVVDAATTGSGRACRPTGNPSSGGHDSSHGGGAEVDAEPAATLARARTDARAAFGDSSVVAAFI